MDRIATGIPGLDKLLGGGLPRNQLVLLTGTSGTGKTTLSCQYIYTGATQFNENAVYLSFEEPADTIKENMKLFGWDFARLEKAGKVVFIRYDPYKIEDAFNTLETAIREIGATRVIVDSVSALGLYIRDEADLRKAIFDLSISLRRLNVTAILTSEIVQGGKAQNISRYGIEEFVTDSVLVLYYERAHSVFSRGLQVWKLRGSTHSTSIHPYKIGSSGFSVNPRDEAFIRH